MQVFARRAAVFLVLAVAAAALLPETAWAQFGSGIPGASAPGRRASAAPEKPTVSEPDAVPGSKPRQPAAPATHTPGDLAPNEALFDAINRGDITAARDALNRGADLGAVNVLGMTPMELSVDLGRNDISFLLLSYRGEDAGRGSRAVARAAAPQGKEAKTEKPAAKAKPAKVEATRAPRTPAPKLFANDGGAPLPSVGFLGFGTRQATN